MDRSFTLAELATRVGGSLRGDGSARITGVADVREAGPTQAAWISNESFADAAMTSSAGVLLVPDKFGATKSPAILCDNIQKAVAALLEAFSTGGSGPAPGTHPSAIIHPSAKIGGGPAIGPHVVIEENVRIGERVRLHAGVYIGRGTVLGDDCEIWPNAVIRDGCTLGSRVILHPCAVIGADGFGYHFEDGRHMKIPHIGGVVLEDDVEIGACTCVDRAKFGNTIVGKGTKIDNQVQVAHNCRLGAHNILAGQTGLSGSVRTGDYCVMGARVASFDNLTIGNNVQLGGLSIVTKDLPDGLKASGHPAQDLRDELREKAAVRRLPQFAETIKDLIKRVERLESATHHNP